MEDGKPGFTTRVVVGKPDKQTPVFSNEMQTIVFNPYWNVPNSIKMEELLPSITGGGGGFFGGGGMYDASVFARNGLRVAIGTKEVDPSQLDWSRIDIRSLNVYQPPGPTNVLGVVKFLFPNKHDVYMHDTTQKNLFAKTIRAESHGCMRVQNPEQLATILLQQDQGWSAQRVASAIGATPDFQVPLKQKIPVYITYFTLKVDDDGSISTFRDLYGHDARMAAAMFGEPMPFDVDTPIVEDFSEPAPVASHAGVAPSNGAVGPRTPSPTASRASSTTKRAPAARLRDRENFRLETNRDGKRCGHEACRLALLEHPVGAVGVRALWQHEPGLENDLGEAGDPVLAIDRSAAREVERYEVEVGASRHRAKGEHEAGEHGSEQEMLWAPGIARAVEILRWRGTQRRNAFR